MERSLLAEPELIIFVSALAENWGTDLILTVESAPPVNVLSSTAPLLGVTSALRTNVAAGVSFYLDDPSVAGGVR